MSSPTGWHADPSDPRVQRYWDGTGWRAQRVWNGAQWVDTVLGVPPPVGTQFAVSPTRRGHRGLWIGGAAVLGVVVAVIAVAAAAGGGGSGGQTHTGFCSDLDAATNTFKSASFEGGGVILDSNPSPAERPQYRQAASTAMGLAARAPSDLKDHLTAIATDYNLALAGRDLTAETETFNAATLAVTEWSAENCA